MTHRKWSDIKRAKGVPEDRRVYSVTARPDGRFLFIEVLGRPELFTQAESADDVERMARDLIAVYDDVDPDSFDVVVVGSDHPAT